MYKDPGIDHVHRLTNSPSLQFVQTGYGWSALHRQNCPARGKNCKNCGIDNHFAKVCRKPEQPYKPKPRVNNVDDSVSEAATVGTSATAAEQFNNIDKHIIAYSSSRASTMQTMTRSMTTIMIIVWRQFQLKATLERWNR